MQVSVAVPLTLPGAAPPMTTPPDDIAVVEDPEVAVISTGPPDWTQVASPLLFTVAMEFSEEDQVTTMVAVFGGWLNTPVAVNWTVPPGAIAEALTGSRLMETRKRTSSPQWVRTEQARRATPSAMPRITHLEEQQW
jgi:hypothetical protein